MIRDGLNQILFIIAVQIFPNTVKQSGFYDLFLWA